MRILFSFLFSSLVLVASAKDIAVQLITETRYGKLRGTIEDSICVWKGIQYAVAERFAPPRPPAMWQGEKDATQYGPVAPQIKGMLSAKGPQSEDCLYLNIWSPAADSKKRPVMVWIHGGSLVVGSGSSPLYDGLSMAKNGDVVVVSINYRLGVLGFLYLKNNPGANNLGLRDQLAALQWVKENIASFGGDPEQVTIFGESAGATSVECLLMSPLAQGLFKAAIAQSGTPAVVWTATHADSLTQKFFTYLRLHPDSQQQLKTLPLDTLMAAQKEFLKYMLTTDDKVFAPTIEGEVLTDNLFNTAAASNIPLLLGTNLDESTLFVKKMKMAPKNARQLDEFFSRKAGNSRQQIFAGYDHYPRKRSVFDILTDAVFRIPNIRLVEPRTAPTYLYRFEWSSFFLNFTGVRCFHGLEMPFVFGNTDRKTSRLIKTVASRKTIARLSGEMQRAWVNFARYGNPNGTEAPVWKPYNLDTRPTMIFDKKSELKSDPDSKQRKAWVGVTYY